MFLYAELKKEITSQAIEYEEKIEQLEERVETLGKLIMLKSPEATSLE
jgi:hypothetical protein